MQVQQVGPQCVFTIAGVDSLEMKLEEAQNELGIDHTDRIPIIYTHNEPSSLL